MNLPPSKFRTRTRLPAAPRWNFRLIDLLTLLLLFGAHLGVFRWFFLSIAQRPDNVSATLGAAALGGGWTVLAAWSALYVLRVRKTESPLLRVLWVCAADAALILGFPICVVVAPLILLVLLPGLLLRAFTRGVPPSTPTPARSLFPRKKRWRR